MAQDDGFLSRWSRRKAQVARTQAPPDEAVETEQRKRAEPPSAPAATTTAGAQAAPPAATPGPPETDARPAPPPPTLEEAQQLTPEADFTRFVGRDVDPQVKNAALKNLFSAPQFNVMDGLDIYIDDYGKPDPLPAGMLQRMTQSAFLGLLRKTPEEEAAARTQAEPAATAGELPSVSPQATLPPEPEAAFGADPATAPTSAAPTDPQDPPRDEDPDLRLQRHDDAGRPGPGQGAEPDPGGQR